MNTNDRERERLVKALRYSVGYLCDELAAPDIGRQAEQAADLLEAGAVERDARDLLDQIVAALRAEGHTPPGTEYTCPLCALEGLFTEYDALPAAPAVAPASAVGDLVEYAGWVVKDIDKHEAQDNKLVSWASIKHWRMLLRKGLSAPLDYSPEAIKNAAQAVRNRMYATSDAQMCPDCNHLLPDHAPNCIAPLRLTDAQPAQDGISANASGGK